MGSCYSTKSNQMPYTTSSRQSSPTTKRTASQSTSTTPRQNPVNAKPTATGSVGGGSFGFRKPLNGGSYGSDKQNGNVVADEKSNTKGAFVKTSVNKGCSTTTTNQRYAAAPARARFGFKKPASGVSAKVGDVCSNRSSDSLHSTASSVSKGSNTSQCRSKSVRSSYATKTSSYKPVSSKEIRMIDSEAGISDSRIVSKVDSAGDRKKALDNDLKPQADTVLHERRVDKDNDYDDRLNANVSVRADTTSNKNTNINSDTRSSAKKPVNRLTYLNTNTRTHSNETSTIADKKNIPKINHSSSTGSKVPSKLVRPFMKSKSVRSPKTDNIVVANRNKTPTRGKENSPLVSKRPKSATEAPKARFGQKGGFLNKTFAKQKSLPEHSSHTNNVDISFANDKTDAVCLEDVVLSDVIDNAAHCERENRDSETNSPQTARIDDVAKHTRETSVGFEVTESDFVVTENIEFGDNILQRISKVHESVGPSVKQRLEAIPLPTGKAPIADGDNVETTSLFSINSDDLMLETEIDLGDYDDDTNTDTPYGSAKSGGAMRYRSRSGSGRLGSRSRSFEKNKGQYVMDKQTPVVTSGRIRTGFKAESSTTEHKIHSDKVHDIDVFEGQGDNDMVSRSAGRTKRCCTYEDGECKALGELNHLINMHNAPVPRRFPRLDKADRPSSFPGFSRQVPDPITDGGHLGILRPPRTNSIGDDEKITIDTTTYRQMNQELTVVKTMLLKLKRFIQDDELTSPLTTGPLKNGFAFNSSQPNSPLKSESRLTVSATDSRTDNSEQHTDGLHKENEELREQVLMMKRQMEEQERTIKLLQQQMVKQSHTVSYAYPAVQG